MSFHSYVAMEYYDIHAFVTYLGFLGARLQKLWSSISRKGKHFDKKYRNKDKEIRGQTLKRSFSENSIRVTNL